jgi:hypothetical protein
MYRAQGNEREAVLALRRALAEVPDDLEAGATLAEMLVDPSERRDLSVEFESTVRQQLGRDPADEDALRKLRQAALWRGERDLEYLALSALVTLGLAVPEEEEAFDSRHRAPVRAPEGRLHEASIVHLRPDGAGTGIAAVAKAAEEVVSEMDRLEPATYGVGRGDVVSAKTNSAVRDEVLALAALFGIEPGDFYVGGSDASQIAAVPGKKGRHGWIVGDGVRAPLGASARFVVGRLAMAIHEGILPYMQRRPEDAAALVLAAAAAAESPLPGTTGRGDVEELRRAIERKMSRRARKAIAEATSTAAGADADAWASAAIRSSLRAGLLLAGDLRVGLAAVLEGPATPDAIAASPVARDLLAFWISDSSLALRRELGVAR